MKLRFLGTGTSFGIPVIGCDCATCRSTDPRDRRTRHAAIIEEGGSQILIDTPPELRLQLLRAEVRNIDAVWFTHFHADHVHGIDDLRVFSMHGRRKVPIYAARSCFEVLEDRFHYVFEAPTNPVPGISRPEGDPRILEAYQETDIAGVRITPLPVPHGDVEVYGFRAGGLGYITDAKELPPRTLEALRGVSVLVLNALWFGSAHPTHFNVEEAIGVAREVGAERTFLTHISHRARHSELLERLPAGIEAAWDGLDIEIPATN